MAIRLKVLKVFRKGLFGDPFLIDTNFNTKETTKNTPASKEFKIILALVSTTLHFVAVL
jgi:hypothetical protein